MLHLGDLPSIATLILKSWYSPVYYTPVVDSSSDIHQLQVNDVENCLTIVVWTEMENKVLSRSPDINPLISSQSLLYR